MEQIDEDTIWYQSNLDVFLNRWFSDYAKARKSLETDGGFLLLYKRHFFVCEKGLIRALGLDPDDPDWKKIEWDCVQPLDKSAFDRLREKRVKFLTDLLTIGS